MPDRQWRWVKVLDPAEKLAVAAECDRFIAEILRPRFLPEIRQRPFNYPIDIFGKWRARKFSFIVRYCSGFPENAGEVFDSAFARLDHVEECIAESRFDVMWHRHTGQWWRLHSAVPLARALWLMETEPQLRPPV